MGTCPTIDQDVLSRGKNEDGVVSAQEQTNLSVEPKRELRHRDMAKMDQNDSRHCQMFPGGVELPPDGQSLT